MKNRRWSYYLIIACLSLIIQNAGSQTFAVNAYPQTQCYVSFNTTVIASVASPVAGATSYSWSITAPIPSWIASYTVTAPNGSVVLISYPCCASWTITCSAYNTTLNPGTPLLISTSSTVTTVLCTPPPTLILNNSANNSTLCAGASATLSVSGAGTYTWLPVNQSGSLIVVTPSVSTCYSVAGTDSVGCTSYSASCVSVQSGSVSISPATQTVCSGFSVNLIAAGAGSYTWNAGGQSTTLTISPTITTTYSVTGNNNGCLSTATSTVEVLPTPIVMATSDKTIICSGQSAILSAVGANSYTWSTGVSGPSISVSPTVSSVYTVTGTSGLCFKSSTVSVKYSAPCVGISESGSANDQIVIYPNPNGGAFFIRSPHISEVNVQIENMMGQTVFRTSSSEGEIEVNAGQIPNGVYVIKILNEAEIQFIGRIVIER